MPTIYDLKPKFQTLLRPAVIWLAVRGVSANQVTVSAALLSVASGVVMALQPSQSWPYLMLPVVLFLRMALNAIDGMLAREHGMKSALGAILNELGDVFSDIALYAPLALLPAVSGFWLGTFLLGLVISEMSGVVAVQIGASRRYDGPLGKSDRAFVLGAVGLALGFDAAPGAWLNGLLALLCLLSVLTVINRARKALNEVRP
jgi:CDP-diacylglycerol---glycerol-3-phosphate 3-phosphatidyltransferase